MLVIKSAFVDTFFCKNVLHNACRLGLPCLMKNSFAIFHTIDKRIKVFPKAWKNTLLHWMVFCPKKFSDLVTASSKLLTA